MDKPVDVLILTAPFGNGHNSAAQAIIEELGTAGPELIIRSVDLFDMITPRLKEYFAESYKLLTRSQPGLYNRLYDLRTRAPFNPIDNIMFRLTFERFLEHVIPMAPSIIISVFPTGSAFASGYHRMVDPQVRLITCITDVVDNWEWVYPETELYFVATEDIADRLSYKGISRERVLVTGVPVRRSFREQRQPQSNVDGTRRQLLILANAMDSVKLDEILLESLAQLDGLHTVIVTGGQKSLHHKLNRINRWPNIEVLGYVENMAELMAGSDLVISKAGGATIFEAVAMELPLLIKKSLVGQENHNVEFVQRAGIGELIDSDESLCGRIQELFTTHGPIQSYRSNIQILKSTLKQDQLAQRVLSMLENGSIQGRAMN